MRQGGLLSPYRVLDLADEKGLIAGKLLADLGADILKVEPPGGDLARDRGPFYQDIPHRERSLFWMACNTSKRGITLNWEAAEGQEIFLKLVKTADFLVESFPPAHMANIGLGYPQLREINPKLIMVSITPFGQEGPYREWQGSDLVLWALGGALHPFGDADRPPVRISVPQAYTLAGLAAASGALLALTQRWATGQGQWVDVSIQAAVTRLSALNPIFSRNTPLRREGAYVRLGGAFLLRQKWQCKDGEVAFRLVGGRFARRLRPLVEWMKEEGMAGKLTELNWDNPDLYGIPDKAAVEEVFARFFLRHTKAELTREAVKRQFMLLPCSTPKDVIDNEHLAQRGFWVSQAQPGLDKEVVYPGLPYRFSRGGAGVGRAPTIGQHNREVYAELGYSPTEIVALKEAGII